MIKSTKLSSILTAAIFSALAIIIFIMILPKLFLSCASLFGFSLDKKDLYVRYILGTISRSMGILAIIYIMFKIDILRKFKFKWKMKYLLFSIIFIAYIVLNIEFKTISYDKIPLLLLMIISCLGIGIFEEVFIRGLALGLLLKAWGKSKKGIYFSVLFSSIIFGLGHIQNYLSGKADLVTTLCQVGYATFIGVMLAAILIRCDFSLWLCAILHALFDIASGIGDVASYGVVSKPSSIQTVNYFDELVNMSLFLPLLIFGLIFLINVKKIDENFNVSLV